MKAEQQLIELATSADARVIADLSRDVIEQGLGWSWTAPRVLKALRDDATNVIVARRLGKARGKTTGDEEIGRASCRERV